MPENDNDPENDNLPQPKEDPVMRDMLARTQYAVLANSRGKEAARKTPEQGIDRVSIDRIWAYLQVKAQHEERAGKIAMMPDNERPVFTEAEGRLLEQRDRDIAELYPTSEAWEQSYPKLNPPTDPQDRAQYDDLAGIASREKGAINVTPEQKEKLDTALANTNVIKEITGGIDVTGKPTPNDPTPIEKAIEIGHDLHKAGVTMDKDDK